VSWQLDQTDREITIEEKVTGAPPEAIWPGGMMGAGGPRTYNLDGSEVTGEMGRGKFACKASWSGDGKALELTSKTTFQG